MTTAILCSILLIPALAYDSKAATEGGRASGKDDVASKAAEKTPEDALRAYGLAVVLHDEAGLRAVTIPMDDLDLLMKDKPAAPRDAGAAKKEVAKRPIRRIKAGEAVSLPNGKRWIVTEAEITPARVILQIEGEPIPLPVVKADGQWKVDARLIIFARHGVEATRRYGEKHQPAIDAK